MTRPPIGAALCERTDFVFVHGPDTTASPYPCFVLWKSVGSFVLRYEIGAARFNSNYGDDVPRSIVGMPRPRTISYSESLVAHRATQYVTTAN